MDKSLHEAPSIAIIGMAGRFPGAQNLEQFWSNLVNGVEGIKQLTDEDLADIEPNYQELLEDPDYVRAAGILDGIELFDADFFGIKPREAKAMDPQHRIWLETAWEAMERAGYAPSKVDGQVGVFTGSYINSYLFYNLSPDRDTIEDFVRLQGINSFLNMITNEKDYLPTRTSYMMDLRGPSINVQTACSTSLVAVAQACQSLLSYESDMALAGGVAIFLPQERGYFYTEGGMLSSDGHCAPFSDKGSGTVFGSGVGCVVLKRLEDAIADNDNIMAVVRGTALNNDGANKASYTAPSIAGQSEVIAMAQAVAGVDPDQIGYVEAHGTATPLGDPIEIAGLSKAFRRQTDKNQFCAVGAVKSGIGHLDAASGVAGLIKTVLTLQNEEIPPTLHFERANPEIEFETTPFYVVNERTPWQRNEQKPRIAGISSFGVGGTNVHAIVQEAPVSEPSSESRPRQLMMLSAKTESALETMAHNLADKIEKDWTNLGDWSNLADAAFTLQHGRTEHAFRRVVVGGDSAEIIEKLRAKGRPTKNTQNNPDVVFMFPGQGSQYPSMGRELYENEPVFKAAIDECAKLLKPILSEDLRDMLYPADAQDEAAADKLKNTGNAQPAIFSVEYALAKLWMSWGIMPTRMIGHSVGEFAAATLAGVFELKDALTVIAQRAMLMRDLPGGSMRAVRLSAEDLAPYLGNGVSLAAHNAPSICVVSGDDDAVDAFDKRMAALGLETIKLHTSHAFHSDMMEPILDPFREIVANVPRSAPTLPIISTVTGNLLSEADATDPDYWAKQLRQPVLFADAITRAMAQPGQVFLEVGPSKNLSNAAQQHAKKEQQHTIIDSLNHAKKDRPALEAMLEAVGKLWMAGVTVNWDAFYERETRRRIELPAYPFERKRYWIDPPTKNELELVNEAAPHLQSPISQSPIPTQTPQPAPAMAYPQQNYQAAPQPQLAPAPSAVAATVAAPAETPQVNIMTRRTQIQNRVKEMLYELSGIEIEQPDFDTSFVELGFDSLTLTQVSTVFKREFKKTVKFRRLLEDISSLNLLTAHFDSVLPAEMFADIVEATPAPPPASAANGNAAPQAQPAAPQPQMQMPMQQPMQQMPQMGMPQMGQMPMGMPQMGMMNPMMAQQMQMMQMMYQQMMAQQAAAMMNPMGFQQQMPMMPQQMPMQQPQMPQQAPAPAAPAAAPRAKAAPAKTSNLPAAPKYANTQNVSNKRFGPYKEVKKGKDGDLTPQQQAHLADLTKRLIAKTPTSKQHAQTYRAVQADPRTIAAFRQTWKELVYQIVAERSKGSKMWDIDGNEYVDITMGFGVSFLGHSPEFVTNAVKERIDRGLEIGPQSKEAGEVAQMMHELTGAERVSFCNTGSEAIMAAVRMARTTTGRDKIVWFSGDYHGTFDEVLARPQIMRGELHTMPAAPGITADSVKNSYILEYGDPASLDFIREHKDEIAGVLIETVQSRHPNHRPAEFVRELRKITAAENMALIFDEVITGFRVHPRGMQAIYDVEPDLSCYGKILGGGIPIGAVAGKATYMDGIDGGWWQYGDDSVPEADLTFFAGTFVRHPMAMAAAKAVLTFINEQGPELQARVNQRMTDFANEMNAFFRQRTVPIEINHYSSWFRVEAATDQQFMDLFFYHLLEKGLYVFTLHQNCFFSIEHTDEDIAKVKQAFKDATIEMQAAGFLPPPPDDPFALTEPQQEILLASQLDPQASLPYNESFSLRLRGQLHPAAMQQAVQAVLSRHGALHHRFSLAGDWQKRDLESQVELVMHDFTGNSAEVAESLAKAEMDRILSTPFDLVNGPIVAVQLIKLADDLHIFHWTAHHIVYDGWSAVIVIDEMRTVYNSIINGENWADKLDEPDSFAEYVSWEVDERFSEEGQEALDYWKQQFANIPAPLDLPSDRPRPARKTYNGTAQHYDFDPRIVAGVRAAAKQQKSSLFMVLLAAYKTLLHRLTGQEDIVVGIPMAGQALAGTDNLIGQCVNIVPIRTQLTPTTPFSQVLGSVRSTFLDAQEYQPMTFGTILRQLNIPRDPSRSPLVEVIFNLDKKVPPEPFANLETEIREVPKHATNWEMFLNVYEEDNTLRADCDYNTDLYDGSTVELWYAQFEQVLGAIARDPDIPLGQLPGLASEETILYEWNDTAVSYDLSDTLVDWFQAQASRVPDNEAVASEDGVRLSYAELDKLTNQWATCLRLDGVKAGDLVGVAMQRSSDMLVALLAVMKAGAAYVPLDPMFPRDRLQMMIDDSSMKTIVTHADVYKALRLEVADDVNVIRYDEMMGKVTDMPDGRVNLAEAVKPAYVIFTSGSTGRPKGVQISHRALANFLMTMGDAPGMDEGDRIINLTTLSFDIAGLELYLPLTKGAAVFVVSAETAHDGRAISRVLETENINVMQATPATWRMIIDAGWEGKTNLKMLCGGEGLPKKLAGELIERGAELWNMYGPTETTIWSSTIRLDSAETITIGRPIANTQMYILDKDQQPVGIGKVGELWIGGHSVADGYIGREDLTAERFVVNPFLKKESTPLKSNEPGQIMYNTGDLARWRPDGTIICLGRSDSQVKIRGYRIELGEIETVLAALPQVHQAVVVTEQVSDDATDKRLVAFVIGTDGVRVDSAELRQSIGSSLPKYMIPSVFVPVNEYPLTPNGKVDRRALLAMPREASVSSAAASASSASASDEAMSLTEIQIANIWQEVLGVENIGRNDDFFELGGHSLNALRLFARIEEQFDVKMPLATLFEASTVAEMAERLHDEGWEAPWSSLVAIQPKGRKKPFFHVGAYMESILAFAELNDYMDSDRPFYGIQPQGIDDESKIQTDFRDMAAHYIKEMKLVQPEGPYLLGGHCAGAIVAYEMATQLEEAGDAVEMLALVDSPAPNFEPPKENPIWYFLKRIMYYLSDARLWHAIVWQYQVHVESRMAYRFGDGNTKPLIAVRQAHDKAYDEYVVTVKPGEYSGPMTIYRSDEYVNLYDENIHTKWAELTDGPVNYETIIGTHATLLKDPNVSVLGEALQRNIAAAEDEVSAETASTNTHPASPDKQTPEPQTLAAV